MSEEEKLEGVKKEIPEESQGAGKGRISPSSDANKIKKLQTSGKALLERVKGRSKEQEAEVLEGTAPPSSPQKAVLSKVRKAAEATKTTMNKMVPRKKSPSNVESDRDNLNEEEEEEEAGNPSDSSRSHVSQVFANLSKNVSGKKKRNAKSLTVEPAVVTESKASKHVQFKDVTSETKSSEPATPRKEKSMAMVQVGPVMSFLLRDSTILVGASLTVAAVPTIWFWESISFNQIPLLVSLAWMFVAFVIGRELERVHGSGQVLPLVAEEDAVAPALTPKQKSVRNLAGKEVEQGPEEQHSIFKKATEKFKTKFRMAGDVEKPRKKKFWTNLSRTKGRDKEHWEENIHANFKLYRDPSVRRMSLMVAPEMDEAMDSATDDLGSFDLGTCTADTLGDYVVEPMLELRGMDVFVPGEEGAEDSMGIHPFLIESGLRNKKTFLVNVMLQWANALIYFELPEWFDDFDNVVENEDDPDDVKALKRFINGNDEYRDKRLKILPALVDGPRIIKYLAPPVKELTVATPILPLSWKKRHTKVCPDGSKRLPMLEVELDCMSSKAMRGMASIIKKNLSGIVLDIAVVIEKPDGATEEEPTACLGMWRFDRVDIETCPMLPERQVSEIEAIRRATVLVGLSPEKMSEIATEAGLGLTSEEMREITADC